MRETCVQSNLPCIKRISAVHFKNSTKLQYLPHHHHTIHNLIFLCEVSLNELTMMLTCQKILSQNLDAHLKDCLNLNCKLLCYAEKNIMQVQSQSPTTLMIKPKPKKIITFFQVYFCFHYIKCRRHFRSSPSLDFTCWTRASEVELKVKSWKVLKISENN